MSWKESKVRLLSPPAHQQDLLRATPSLPPSDQKGETPDLYLIHGVPTEQQRAATVTFKSPLPPPPQPPPPAPHNQVTYNRTTILRNLPSEVSCVPLTMVAAQQQQQPQQPPRFQLNNTTISFQPSYSKPAESSVSASLTSMLPSSLSIIPTSTLKTVTSTAMIASSTTTSMATISRTSLEKPTTTTLIPEAVQMPPPPPPPPRASPSPSSVSSTSGDQDNSDIGKSTRMEA